jgi:hypothetical protein
MKTDTYIGIFKNDGDFYELTAYCNSFLQAFFLLTAEAIKTGRHWQLDTIIKHDTGTTVKVDNIQKCSDLLTY